MSAQFACGQILFCLKNSNLNYLVKETPYSAYITIRKKFVKEISENVTFNFEETSKKAKIKQVKNENDDL